MEPNDTGPSLESSLREVMKSLPPVIRAYINDQKYTPAAQRLMSQYQLRIDQGGVLEREILLLLMGVETPDDFMKSLSQDAHIDEATIGNIVRDVNEQIFIPLRAEEMKAPGPRPADEGAHFKLQNKIPLPSRPMGRPAGGAPDFSHMLEDHEEPHIDLGKRNPPQPISTRTTVPPMPAKTAPPPANLPGQVGPQPAAGSVAPRIIPAGGRAPGPAPAAGTPAPAAPNAPAPAAGLTFSTPKPPPLPYSVDPYREPIDEEGK